MNQTINTNEIAQKLHISLEEVNKSSTIKNTYYQIKNDPTLSEPEKEGMYKEMSDIYKTMLQKKK